MNLPPYIVDSLQSPTDYSPEFTTKIDNINHEICMEFGILATHDATMDYRASQSLAFNVSGRDPYRLVPDGEIEVRIYVSSRGELFCFYCFDRKGILYREGMWKHPVPLKSFPVGLADWFDKIRNVMNRIGYDEVGEIFFNEPAPGCSTELDGLPATVFQVLFSEIE
jgi:hypothetical protein